MYNILSMVSVVGVVVSRFVLYINTTKNAFLFTHFPVCVLNLAEFFITGYGYFLFSRNGTNSMADYV